MVIPVPLAPAGRGAGTGPAGECAAQALVAAAYGATHLMADGLAGASAPGDGLTLAHPRGARG